MSFDRGYPEQQVEVSFSDQGSQNEPPTVVLSPEQEKARSRRNIVIALSLFAFVALVFVVTMVRLSANISASQGM